ncbi:interleukin-13 receptor subunit alpha-2 isoform X2 [Engraulis encrasicolus]
MHRTMEMFSVILAVITVFSPSCFSEDISVEPPVRVSVKDLGLLGQLSIHWSPPPSLQNVTGCSIRYQLEYFNTYKNEWRAYRTPRTSFIAQFDLGQDVRVKLRTMLRGKCTKGVERSSETLERTWPPHLTGVAGSKVRNIRCVFHRKEDLECTWGKAAEEPHQAQRHLYYWYNGLEAVAECPEYISSGSQGGQNHTGCRFPRDKVKEFTDFNVCVNGTSAQGPLTPAYVSLQLQNHVKPGPVKVEAMSLQLKRVPEVGGEELEGVGEELELTWLPPAGRIPPHCLEYEVTTRHTDHNGKESKTVTKTEETSLVIPANKKKCARVRSHVHEYCSDSSIWSEWSQWTCYKMPPATVVTL